MGSTPNLGLPYPEQADTPDVPRDIRALAVKVDDTVADINATVEALLTARRVWFGSGGSASATGPIALGTATLIDPEYVSRSGEMLTILKTGLYSVHLQATGNGLNHVMNVYVGGPVMGSQQTCSWQRDGAQYTVTCVCPFVAGQKVDFSITYRETGALASVFTNILYLGAYAP